jgi:hypothetical protein
MKKKKKSEDIWMVFVLIVLFLTIGALFLKSNIIYTGSVYNQKYVSAASGSGKGECYINWDGADCEAGFDKIKAGKMTVVSDPETYSGSVPGFTVDYYMECSDDLVPSIVDSSPYGFNYTCPGNDFSAGSGDVICANTGDLTEAASWGLAFEASNYDCAVCCRI